ncbi:hypothetical protein [Candidatus Vallotia lariciata]|uniref:hypothetical protein n=1 Tax=Candidatus Vallotia laricis TaxID=2018052 RepID=UPI001D00BA6F|nr:hypothetical protein [Candidatus Vallotia lariciata]UDG83114.1 hypothetical protein GKR41_00491 [Candidatus Vallotia lariciata]
MLQNWGGHEHMMPSVLEVLSERAASDRTESLLSSGVATERITSRTFICVR